jgi:hypothetical protein
MAKEFASMFFFESKVETMPFSLLKVGFCMMGMGPRLAGYPQHPGPLEALLLILEMKVTYLWFLEPVFVVSPDFEPFAFLTGAFLYLDIPLVAIVITHVCYTI